MSEFLTANEVSPSVGYVYGWASVKPGLPCIERCIKVRMRKQVSYVHQAKQ